MNILFVTGLFAKENASISGMPNYIYKTVTALEQRGHNAYILTADDKSCSWKYKGVAVYSVKIFPRLRGFAWLSFGLQSIIRDAFLQRKLRRLVEELNIDMIQYTGWFGVGCLHSAKIGVPAVMRMSSYARVQLISAFTPKQIDVISRMERWASRNMDAIFAPSRVIANGFAQDIHREVKVIETPFQLEIDPKDWDYSVYNKKLKGKKYFLFFGRLSPDKGILTIARSLYSILCKHEDIFFVFAGDLFSIDGRDILDMFRDYGKEHIERILYLGSLQKEKLYPIVSEACAVLIPSLMDNLPNSCMEAMYLRKIVIGTKGTSLDQLIQDQVSGLLIEADNDEMLVDQMNMILEMPAENIKDLGDNAHERILRLRPENTVRELEEFYQSVRNTYVG